MISKENFESIQLITFIANISIIDSDSNCVFWRSHLFARVHCPLRFLILYMWFVLIYIIIVKRENLSPIWCICIILRVILTHHLYISTNMFNCEAKLPFSASLPVTVSPNGGHRMCTVYWLSSSHPKGGRESLMSPSCLKSQGCHLIPLFYLLFCSSTPVARFFPSPFFCWYMALSPDFCPRKTTYFSLKNEFFFVWLLFSS